MGRAGTSHRTVGELLAIYRERSRTYEPARTPTNDLRVDRFMSDMASGRWRDGLVMRIGEFDGQVHLIDGTHRGDRLPRLPRERHRQRSPARPDRRLLTAKRRAGSREPPPRARDGLRRGRTSAVKAGRPRLPIWSVDDQPTATGCPMIKLVFTIRRQAGHDPESSSSAIWREEHGARWWSDHASALGVRRYVQTHARDTDIDETALRLMRQRAPLLRRRSGAVGGTAIARPLLRLSERGWASAAGQALPALSSGSRPLTVAARRCGSVSERCPVNRGRARAHRTRRRLVFDGRRGFGEAVPVCVAR